MNLSNDSPLPGSVATYTCASGYVIEGTSMRECTCDGWSGRDPTCIVIGELSIDLRAKYFTQKSQCKEWMESVIIPVII